MKKIFSKAVFLMYSLLGASINHAQVNHDVTAVDLSLKQGIEMGSVKTMASPADKAAIVLSAMFSNATNVTWSKYGKSLPFAYFETPGKKHRAGFDKKGNLVFLINYYREEHLPAEILLRVKETYFGKSIFCVTEVNYEGKTAYLIVLEDKTSWLHIKIIGDEMTEEKTFLKG